VIDLVPEPEAASVDVTKLFGRDAPLHVDLGCGDGSLLSALAADYPDRNFLGIDRLLRRVRCSDRKAAIFPNIQIIRSETMFVLRHLLPANSVDAFYLLFPDPWPKRRHHRRRLVTTKFFDAVWTCLTNSGSLFVATDHDEYFTGMRRLLTDQKRFVIADRDWSLPTSKFEKRFNAAGTAIHRLELRKV